MAEEKKGLFGAAKVKAPSKAKKDDKETIVVPGLEQKLKDLQEFKAQIADLEALVSGISDELKVLGKEKFIELYLRDKANPNTFLIKDGEGCIMFLPMDKYIGIKDQERADKLKAEYGDVVTKDERFYFNAAVLERNQETIEKLLMGSTEITDADKDNLLVKEVKLSIKKGSIDDLLKYGDKMSTVVDDIQPIFQIKNCGGTLADGGSADGEVIYDSRYDEAVFQGRSNCCDAPVYGMNDICTDCGEHCEINHDQFAGGGDLSDEELMGGQSNSSLKPSGYKIISVSGKEIIVSDDGGETKERYIKSNGFSGYHLVYKGNDYEFVNSFARGGYVSKGELVWKKLTGPQKTQFLYENFTSEITPRSQEILVGKTFNFLPKNVKIKIEAKYADVEEYSGGGKMSGGGKLNSIQELLNKYK